MRNYRHHINPNNLLWNNSDYSDEIKNYQKLLEKHITSGVDALFCVRQFLKNILGG